MDKWKICNIVLTLKDDSNLSKIDYAINSYFHIIDMRKKFILKN